jgi:hypothetical protein
MPTRRKMPRPQERKKNEEKCRTIGAREAVEMLLALTLARIVAHIAVLVPDGVIGMNPTEGSDRHPSPGEEKTLL